MILFWILAVIVNIWCPSSIGFPYTGEDDSRGPAPLRLNVLHTRRTFMKIDGSQEYTDGGISIEQKAFRDPSEELENHVMKYRERKRMTLPDKCEERISCGVPFSSHMASAKGSRIDWIDYHIPDIPEALEAKVELMEMEYLNQHNRRYKFVVSGANTINALLAIPAGMRIRTWNNGNGFTSDACWQGRNVYMVNFFQGHKNKSESIRHHFEFELESVGKIPNENFTLVLHTYHVCSSFLGPFHGHQTLIVAVGSHIQFGNHARQSHFEMFLKTFPDWAAPTAWTVDLKHFQFRL